MFVLNLQDVARPSSCTYDAYDSVSERQSEAASSSIYRPAGRQPNRSTSLRSSAASSDGLCSPGNPRHAHTGASSVHSYFTGGPNASAPDRLAPAFDAEPVGSSQSIFSNQDYGLGLDAQRQTLSPEAGNSSQIMLWSPAEQGSQHPNCIHCTSNFRLMLRQLVWTVKCQLLHPS